QYRERLTPRGQSVFWTVVALAVLGLDTRRTQAYVLFSAAAGIFLMAAFYALLPRPKLQIECRVPERATALVPLKIHVRMQAASRGRLRDLQLKFPRPRKWGSSIRYHPPAVYCGIEPGQVTQAQIELLVSRRGRYLLRGATVRSTDPLRLAATRATALADQVLLAYPRFYSMEEFLVPLGRRYQPGGIPLSSSTGDAIEFVGTREYREGDPIKNIHWRSWARRGEPVVKEYQEEYFCRLALILDTFLPAKHGEREARSFEAAISVLASIADFFSRSEYIVDILAAGPDLYEVSAGRSLAYLENILDVLACLEPSPDPPFQTIGPHLFEKLAQITTVVAVLQDWDPARLQFLRQVKELGTAVRVMVVHDGPTREPWQHIGAELGEITQLSPDDVERLLASSGSKP
ncbi:MAG: DUF58 domain-containing protein, partial [Terriglobales bacterium]